MNSTLLIVLVLAVVVAFALKGRGKKSTGSSAPKPPTSGWYFGPIVNGKNYSIGMPSRPAVLAGAVWDFAFKTAPAEVDAVVKGSPPALVGAKSLAARISITGGGFFAAEKPSEQPIVSLVLQRKGDDWSGEGSMQGYRFYSRAAVDLQAGTFTLLAPLDPAHWFDVRGQRNDAAFAACLAELDNLAIAFGYEAGGRSHGVYATQPSRFTLLSFDVIR